MIRRLMVLTTLILLTLTSGALASAATPTEAIDSLEEARGLFRQGLFMGDIETLDRSRDMRFAALDALDEMDPQSITGVPWPERIAWMEHALFERRADWSMKLLGALRASSADPFPPVGSANRGMGALVAGMSADAALRGVPNLASDDKASLRSFAERAYEVSARENFLLRDEAFYRLWRLGDARDNLAMMAEWSDSLAVATPRSLRTPATRLTRVQRFLDLGDFGEALQEARLAMPKGDSAEMRWAMAEANFGLDFEGQGARELEKLIGSFGGQRLAWDAYEKRLRLGDSNTNLYVTKEQRFNLLKPLLKGSTAKRAEAALKTLADQNRSMRAQILSALTEYYYKTKRYSDAEPYLKELIEGSDSISRRAQLTYARLLRNSGRIAPMEELYERLVAAGGSHGQKAIWELAREYESLARWEDANTAYSRLLSLFPGHGKKDKARYRRGFARYRMGAYVDAESDFRTLFRKTKGSAEEEAAFWLAKSLEAQGKDQEAQAVGSGAISSSFPAGFYGVSLRRDYGKETTAVQSTPLPPVEPEESVETMLQDAGWPTVLERHFRRGLAYARLGEFQQARREWKHCEKLKQGPSRFYRVLALASATYGIYPEGVSWARAAAQNLASGDPRRVGYDRLSYPAAFYDAVSHWSKDRGLLTDEVWAMMRQESLYDPHAVSRAGARGLLQIMPSTLERMINQGDYPPATADVLFRPLVNIELSTRFFKDRLTEFDDMLLPALASYNAGEGKSHQWLERSQGDPNEMFLECVGYPETYGYIRRIVWMAWLYRSYYPKLAEQDLRDARTR